jgi:hypothetical protein
MRSVALFLSLTIITACTEDSLAPPTTPERMTIDTPPFTLSPGDREKFYCYYTTLPTTEAVGLRRIASRMTPGSHHMIVFTHKTKQQPDGTLVECDGFGMGPGGGFSEIPVWLYASQEPERETMMPEGVGLEVAAGQPVMVNMHYVNLTDESIMPTVHVELEPLAPGETYTPAHTFITFNTQIDVPPNATGSAGGSCMVPPDVKFIEMSTHSHQYTTSARIMDGDKMVLETLDWAHAKVERWQAPYFTFSSGKLDYLCQYNNTTDQPLVTGESAVANEMCMAVGTFFPATKDIFCLNSMPLPF